MEFDSILFRFLEDMIWVNMKSGLKELIGLKFMDITSHIINAFLLCGHTS